MVSARRLICGLWLAAIPSFAFGAGLSPDEAVALAQSHMRQAGMGLGVPVPPSRHLPDCPTKVLVKLPSDGSGLIGLSCPNPKWTRNLRIEGGQSRIAPIIGLNVLPQSDDTSVMALQRPMAKGEVIEAQDLVEIKVSAASLPETAFLAPELLIGRKLKQTVSAGKPIYARHLEPDFMVLEGHTVSIISQVGPARIAMVGRALGSAGLGEKVVVENLSSGRKIEARVIQRDVVDVSLKSFAKLP